LEKQSEKESLLMIDYVIHFQKSNGKATAKVFNWLQRLEVIVNGIKKAQIEFELLFRGG
jgi:hypothetical protein